MTVTISGLKTSSNCYLVSFTQLQWLCQIDRNTTDRQRGEKSLKFEPSEKRFDQTALRSVFNTEATLLTTSSHAKPKLKLKSFRLHLRWILLPESGSRRQKLRVEQLTQCKTPWRYLNANLNLFPRCSEIEAPLNVNQSGNQYQSRGENCHKGAN